MGKLLDILAEKQVLVSDGAWGTFLYQRGLEAGDCPELWNDTHRSDVLTIARSYVEAGADLILTNSFGGSPIKLSHYGLADRAEELNRKAAEISREAAGADCLVAGSIGPTGEMLMMGNVSEQQVLDGFLLQAQALKDGGVDALVVETMSAIDEAALAVKAALSTGLDVACTFTFDRTVDNNFKTMMGVSVESMVKALTAAGAHIIGSNCGNGFDQMIEIVTRIRATGTRLPVLIHANAGLPDIRDGQTVFPESPESMAGKVDALLASGADIIGGCCGTTPEHIRLMVEAVRRRA
ncbi:MAG: homocysteine S-methyltransferase family protein [Pontiellaceae bacterium]|nr:homocysteine S-methyltransferase family protein [Pontiellaceae bacterium]